MATVPIVEAAARPDIFGRLFSAKSNEVVTPSSPAAVAVLPQPNSVVVQESRRDEPQSTSVRVVTVQPDSPDVPVRLVIPSTGKVSAQSRPPVASTNASPFVVKVEPSTTVATNAAQPDAAKAFAPLPAAISEPPASDMVPSHSAPPSGESIVVVPQELYQGLFDAGTHAKVAQQPAKAPAATPFSEQLPALPLANYPSTSKAPAASSTLVQQPVGVVTDAPIINVPQYTPSHPPVNSRIASVKPVEQPVGIVTDAPAVAVPQYVASTPIAQLPAAPQRAMQQPVGIAKEPPAIVVPQPVLHTPVAQMPTVVPQTIPTPIETVASAPAAKAKHEGGPSTTGLPAAPNVVATSPTTPVAVTSVAPAPIAVAPLAQPTLLDHNTPVVAASPASSTRQQRPISPEPAQVATNHAPVAARSQATAAPAPSQQLIDYRLIAVSDDARRPVSRYADLQQPRVSTEPANSLEMPSVETFAFADVYAPGTHEKLAEPHPMASNQAATNPAASLLPGSSCLNSGPNGCPYLPGQSGAPFVCGVDCGAGGAPCNARWRDSQCIPWSLFGPGEYVGPARPEHVSTYYLRVNDLVTLTFITSRKKEAERYHIGVGDRLRLEWLRGPANTDASLDREVLVQPDGSIALPLVGEMTAAGKTVKDLQAELVKAYGQFQRDPQITVTPLEVNIAVQDIISAVTGISGSNGQTQALKVTPEGTIQAPGIGSVYVQGLTLEELRSELEARYASSFGPGLLVSPSLTERATMYVFVGGEVKTPARYELQGPTTVMQAITLAGGWNVGGNLHQVVVFRRDENWCLKATKIDVRAPLYGNDPCPANDIWLRDNDLVIVPKSKILCATDVIQLYFTRGIYAAFPINYVYDFSASSGIVPVP